MQKFPIGGGGGGGDPACNYYNVRANVVLLRETDQAAGVCEIFSLRVEQFSFLCVFLFADIMVDMMMTNFMRNCMRIPVFVFQLKLSGSYTRWVDKNDGIGFCWTFLFPLCIIPMTVAKKSGPSLGLFNYLTIQFRRTDRYSLLGHEYPVFPR